MPRTSAASLSVVSGELTVTRPAPPEELNSEEAKEWRQIVDRMPYDWFPRETHPMLMQLCRLTVQSDKLAKMIDTVQSAKKPNPAVYLKLLRAQMQLSDSISRLSTKMRISQQSSYDVKKAKGPTGRPPAQTLWDGNRA